MSKYSTEFRNNILRKVLPTESRSIAQISCEEGIAGQTIRNWVFRVKDGFLDATAGDLSPDRRSITAPCSLDSNLPQHQEPQLDGPLQSHRGLKHQGLRQLKNRLFLLQLFCQSPEK